MSLYIEGENPHQKNPKANWYKNDKNDNIIQRRTCILLTTVTWLLFSVFKKFLEQIITYDNMLLS